MLGCIIQARMGSTRLPGKILMQINGNTLLSSTIKQVKCSKLLKKIIVATTNSPEDDVVVEYLNKLGIPHYRGSIDNVLDRYYQCALVNNLSIIVRITSDNPFVDPMIIDKVIKKFNESSYDYVSNTHPRTFPQGTDVEVFSFSALEHSWKNATKLSEKEHVTPFIYNNSANFKIGNVFNSDDLSSLRWTVDTQEDLELIKKICFKIKKSPILTNDIVELFSKEPDLSEINKNHVINEGYLKSLKND